MIRRCYIHCYTPPLLQKSPVIGLGAQQPGDTTRTGVATRVDLVCRCRGELCHAGGQLDP